MGKRTRPIRKLVDQGDVPLPQSWEQFIALEENKADLATFLSNWVISRGTELSEDKEIVTGGGFCDSLGAKSNVHGLQPPLDCSHEEADTRMILHTKDAINQGFHRVQVQCNDTDVLLLLVHFFGQLQVDVWMISGTAKQRKCYPVGQIAASLSPAVVNNILGFHALIGCDSTSSLTGIDWEEGLLEGIL